MEKRKTTVKRTHLCDAPSGGASPSPSPSPLLLISYFFFLLQVAHLRHRRRRLFFSFLPSSSFFSHAAMRSAPGGMGSGGTRSLLVVFTLASKNPTAIFSNRSNTRPRSGTHTSTHPFGPLVHTSLHAWVHWSIQRSMHRSIGPYIGLCIGPFIGPFIGPCIGPSVHLVVHSFLCIRCST